METDLEWVKGAVAVPVTVTSTILRQIAELDGFKGTWLAMGREGAAGTGWRSTNCNLQHFERRGIGRPSTLAEPHAIGATLRDDAFGAATP